MEGVRRRLRRAAAEDLHLVAHAGEEGEPETIAAALDVLHVGRVDHGIRAMEDPALVQRLRDQRVPLTVCPLSNVCLRMAGSLADHPLPVMLAEGLMVTVKERWPTSDPPHPSLIALTGRPGAGPGRRFTA